MLDFRSDARYWILDGIRFLFERLTTNNKRIIFETMEFFSKRNFQPFERIELIEPLEHQNLPQFQGDWQLENKS